MCGAPVHHRGQSGVLDRTRVTSNPESGRGETDRGRSRGCRCGVRNVHVWEGSGGFYV